MERSKKAIEKADLVILVVDASKGMGKEDEEILSFAAKKKTLVCYNKSDLINNKDKGKLLVSAKKGELEPLKEAIFSSLGLAASSFVSPSFSNARELGVLRQIDQRLSEVEKGAQSALPPDQEAYNLSRKLLGEDPTQDLGEEIFSRFCVGK